MLPNSSWIQDCRLPSVQTPDVPLLTLASPLLVLCWESLSFALSCLSSSSCACDGNGVNILSTLHDLRSHHDRYTGIWPRNLWNVQDVLSLSCPIEVQATSQCAASLPHTAGPNHP